MTQYNGLESKDRSELHRVVSKNEQQRPQRCGNRPAQITAPRRDKQTRGKGSEEGVGN